MSSAHRSKRSMSWENNVEVMVVADKKMAAYHGKELQHYVLTLMAIVASIYRSPSIGNAVNIVVVKLLALEKAEDGPSVTANAAATLRNFCKWQSSVNDMDDNSPNHHDTAVLITRQDICRSATKCDTLGLAELGTMCDPNHSCSISEDNGLSAAFTIAHEVGHVFNLPHDDDFKCKKYDHGTEMFQLFPEQRKSGYHVMAPTLDYNTNHWSWSKCSTYVLTEFLDAGKGECLRDVPVSREFSHVMQKQHKTSGELFDVDRQCELVFGAGSRKCPYMPLCRRLWCTNVSGMKNGCRTQHMPWAEGTRCARNMWCQKGQCVPRHQQKAVSGNWGEWQPWGKCTRTCGGGIEQSIRFCDNPVPRNGGTYCGGRRVKYRSCNTRDCPPSKKNFRDHQCAKFDGRHFNINGLPPTVRWVPKYAGILLKDRCKLFCQATTSNIYHRLSEKVIDGTKCGPDTADICVNGMCRPAGCDNRLNSRATRDLCGVCGGDNSTCKTLHGEFLQGKYGYNIVHKIPKGATHIMISQHSYNRKKDDDSYLALMNSKRQYILNGNFIVSQFKGEVKVQGGLLDYTGSDEVIEKINSTKGVKEDIYLLVLTVGDLSPANVKYSYSISVSHHASLQGTEAVRIKVSWKVLGQYTECSRICQGTRQRKVVCVREDQGTIISGARCLAARRPRPPTEACNKDCELGWQILKQSECSVHCGTGSMTRQVRCIKRTIKGDEAMDDGYCQDTGRKPSDTVSCNGRCLPTHLEYTDWTKCSASCGGGVQRREATCMDSSNQRLPQKECAEKRVLTQECNVQPCPGWVTEKWTGCSVSCGSGQRFRQVYCAQDGRLLREGTCDIQAKPISSQSCKMYSCPAWQQGAWGDCSVTCGQGYRMRAVRCRSSNGDLLDDSVCDAASRPQDTYTCQLGPCTTPAPATTPYATTLSSRVYQWRTGSWTSCSVTCGEGKRQRYVSCRDQEGSIAPDAMCRYAPKPNSMEMCVTTQACGQWRSGEWSQCSATCGEGVTSRAINCIMLDEQLADFKQCDIKLKPVRERLCNRQACIGPKDYDIARITSNRVVGTSHWRVGPWSGCSASCGNGRQRRLVVCQDERGASNDCDKHQKPVEIQPCDHGQCPQWRFGEWSSCSVSCGGGIQNRAVLCQTKNGNNHPHHECDILKQPQGSRICNTHACPKQRVYRWRADPWAVCSVSCGRGIKVRKVDCLDHNGAVVQTGLCETVAQKPSEQAKCKMGRCPKWSATAWSKCSATCGTGTRERKVKCIRGRHHQPVDPKYCMPKPRPRERETCSVAQCRNVQWKPERWSKCSKTCGSGMKVRNVTCVNKLNGEAVEKGLCYHRNKPRTQRQCTEGPCPFIWQVKDWAQCSASCGVGQQSRAVTCHAVTREGWVLPGEITYGCNTAEKPEMTQRCQQGDCHQGYVWRVGQWGQCSAKCGKGKVRRRTHCINLAGQKQSRRRCNQAYKPETTKQCHSQPCYASSCKELKKMSGLRRDGDYKLLIQGRLLQVYCHGMRKSKPREYLTLPAGEKENFSEIYEKRLIQTSTCPFNGTRNRGCDCSPDPYPRSGFTKFSKFRFNITSLRITINDFRYSSSHGKNRIPVGTAGDCYSATVCPQGRFRINLAGTGLKVSPEATWQSYGFRTTKRIYHHNEDQLVEGLCGGYCGHCGLHVATGLQLILQP